MCGIAGQVHREPADAAVLCAAGQAMATALRHRGPDMSGIWVEPNGRGVLAFSRLAIQDLSPEANQPMQSESGRFVIAYNGEVYNPEELRALIHRTPQSFRTHSDTEVLLACIEEMGLERTLRTINGMFAIALWDRLSGLVFLARDRLGKKPLHYTVDGRAISFASEIKAILTAEDSARGVSTEAVEAYFSLMFIPAPLTIFEGIRKVRPGQIVEIDRDLRLKERQYWSIEDVYNGAELARGSYAELMEEADSLLTDATRRRLIGDVPAGVLLSGGVDSSLVAHALAKKCGVKLRTFTIGLEDELDESREARAVADELGVENNCLTLKPADALNLVDTVVDHLDEPFGDYSALPTYAVCNVAKAGATVLLTGDGGDEVFGGYTRYCWATGWRRWMARLYGCWRQRRPWLSPAEVAQEIYRRLMTAGPSAGSMRPSDLEDLLEGRLRNATVLQHLRHVDFQLYLPDDILAKTDRMAMANSIELRSPFLDYRLVEFSWRLPDSALVRGTERRRITRDLFVRNIGERYLQKQKHGFGIPIWDWLKGPLREQLRTAIEELSGWGILPAHVAARERLAALQAGDRRAGPMLWMVFAFWRWARRYGDIGSAKHRVIG
ncbi:MAG: asparagine synthase (glutamine-hydrolyzing) [Terriglobales bacterium]